MSDPPATAEDAVVISGDSDIYVGGPLDMPGATVEIVETEPISMSMASQRRPLVKKKPEFREQLLLRLVLLHQPSYEVLIRYICVSPPGWLKVVHWPV